MTIIKAGDLVTIAIVNDISRGLEGGAEVVDVSRGDEVLMWLNT